MESVNLKSVFSAQFYEVLISNIPMSSPLTSTTYFLKDLTHGEAHSSRFVLLKQPHHWEKLLFNLQPQQGCSSAGFFSLHHPACAVLHLPPLLSLVPLAAGAAWLGVPEAVSRHLPLLEVQVQQLSADGIVWGCRGIPEKQHQIHWRILPLFSGKSLDTCWTDELRGVHSKQPRAPGFI